jgi:uncharacterized radical SAM protein YgiQ
LLDSSADILSYGMGEKSTVEIAEALDAGIDVRDITFVRGTCYKTKDDSCLKDSVVLPSFEKLTEDKLEYAKSFYTQYVNTDPYSAKTLVESYGNRGYVVQNPPSYPLTQMEMDDVYELPYMNNYHPVYEKLGGIPAIEEIKFSLTSNRGCFGGCSFCALTFHQGRILQTRSHESLVAEATRMTKAPDFKGYIHDVGGPTANFRNKACKKQEKYGVCQNRQCLFPKPCENLKADHSDYVKLLRKIRQIPGVKKVFIRSGIRFDYVMADDNDEFLRELCENHISGQLRVAPEHVSDRVLKAMGKPSNSVYEAFLKRYEKVNSKTGKKQYVVPYLMSSHPGSTLEDAVKLAEYVRDIGYMPEQVQDFYPTPSTISTCMYYTGVDPRTMKEIYVARNPHEKAMQKALMMYRKPENYQLVKEALILTGRTDLIGFDKKCLIPPRKMSQSTKYENSHGAGGQKSGRKSENRPETGRQKNGRKSESIQGKDRQKNVRKSESIQGKDRQKNVRKSENRQESGRQKSGRRDVKQQGVSQHRNSKKGNNHPR